MNQTCFKCRSDKFKTRFFGKKIKKSLVNIIKKKGRKDKHTN